MALSADELQTLGLGKAKAADLADKLAKLKADFHQAAAKQKSITPQTTWEQFSGSKPGVVPTGSEDSTKDLRAYENVVAIVQTAGKHTQVQIGTLVQVGDCWKAIDAPHEASDNAGDAVAGGFFFQAPNRGGDASGGAAGDEIQKLLADLEELDKTAATGDDA